uniref:Uncharacterized protein n=1 Tax=Setaria digitata TaxID=48799 RepID=A0A915PMM7_9BILA
MQAVVRNTVRKSEGASAGEVDDTSEEENGDDELKCLDWLVSYKLPDNGENLEYFSPLDDSFHQFIDLNLLHNYNTESVSKVAHYRSTSQYAVEQVFCNSSEGTMSVRLFSYAYGERFDKKLFPVVLAIPTTGYITRRPSIPGRYISPFYCSSTHMILHGNKLTPDWKYLIGQALVTSKCFACKHSLWFVNDDLASKYVANALLQGPYHRCPPPLCSSSERSVRTDELEIELGLIMVKEENLNLGKNIALVNNFRNDSIS